MNLAELKQLAELMKRADLTEVEVEEKGLKLRMVRGDKEGGSSPTFVATPAPFSLPMAPAGTQAPMPEAAAPADAPAKEEAGIVYVKSPMVGTLYRAPSPESPAFVDVGDVLKKDSVVCIIEAMKVMNEIQSEVSGKIVEVLVENGTSVEYGQPIFKVKQSG